MHPSRVAAMVVALSAAGAPAVVSAQTSIFVMGGMAVPNADYSEYAENGWMAQAGVGVPLGAGAVTLGASGFYGVNNHAPPPDGDKTNLYGALGFLQYTIGDPTTVSPYVYAGGGFMVHAYKSETFAEDSASGLAATAGTGVNVPLGGILGFVEAEYLTAFGDVDGTDLFVISAGVVFEVGG